MLLIGTNRLYHAAMAVSARDVAADLRDRLPGLGTKKLHKLLYYCQGHHLATFGEPLFRETVSAWDMGPVVGTFWREEKDGEIVDTPPVELGEAQLNTIGYVVSRYGALTGADLERLSHSEPPWREADRAGRPPRGSVPIRNGALIDYFSSAGAAGDDEDAVVLDSVEIATWLEGAEERAAGIAEPDSPEALRAWLASGA
jgi:uncharacterized phage-associated protein